MRYLLDTNMVSDLVRHPQGQVTQAIRAVGEPQVCTSIVVAAELRYGATKRGSPRLTAQLDAILTALEILPVSYTHLSPQLRRPGNLLHPREPQ